MTQKHGLKMFWSVKPLFSNCELWLVTRVSHRALGTDNLPYKLEKERGLSQICNVNAATTAVFPSFGLVMEQNGKKAVYFLENNLLIITTYVR